ncbi:MAG TPA: HD-GYP domain-containing protein [Bdellovibrionota bacterium]|jgi:HD-GYP domain-containing protein (c-di-GMP phosphodiesterase class II)|nr:HD-GYP domain-containing protein [Bdellovibrionota bacterium]
MNSATKPKTEALIGEAPDWAWHAIEMAMAALKAKDPYTYEHCLRVGNIARLIAEAAGLNWHEQRICEFSGMLHDVGKMGTPDGILKKPAKLTAEEDKIMQEHPLHSVRIVEPLARIPFFRFCLPGIRNHHERIDGRGYPDGLSGDMIPLTARIVTVADSFDAMTNSRVYRKGLSFEYAFKELKVFSGSQFDLQLVKIFLQAFPHWEKAGEVGRPAASARETVETAATPMVQEVTPLKRAA